MCNQVQQRKEREREIETEGVRKIQKGGILHVHNFIEWILPVVLCNGMVYGASCRFFIFLSLSLFSSLFHSLPFLSLFCALFRYFFSLDMHLCVRLNVLWV